MCNKICKKIQRELLRNNASHGDADVEALRICVSDVPLAKNR